MDFNSELNKHHGKIIYGTYDCIADDFIYSYSKSNLTLSDDIAKRIIDKSEYSLIIFNKVTNKRYSMLRSTNIRFILCYDKLNIINPTVLICSPEDSFNKKWGRKEVLMRMVKARAKAFKDKYNCSIRILDNITKLSKTKTKDELKLMNVKTGELKTFINDFIDHL